MVADTLQLPKENGTRWEEAAAVASLSARFQSPGTCLWAAGGSGGANGGISQPPTGVPCCHLATGMRRTPGLLGDSWEESRGGAAPRSACRQTAPVHTLLSRAVPGVSRPVCLADTRAPVGVSEQASGSRNSPRSLGSGQETPVTVGLLGLHWSGVITQQ